MGIGVNSRCFSRSPWPIVPDHQGVSSRYISDGWSTPYRRIPRSCINTGRSFASQAVILCCLMLPVACESASNALRIFSSGT